MTGSRRPLNGPSTRSIPSIPSIAAASRLIRPMLSVLVASPVTVARIVIGEVSPALKSVARATAASRLSSPGGSVLAFGRDAEGRRLEESCQPHGTAPWTKEPFETGNKIQQLVGRHLCGRLRSGNTMYLHHLRSLMFGNLESVNAP